jgi:hypothetical protein
LLLHAAVDGCFATGPAFTCDRGPILGAKLHWDSCTLVKNAVAAHFATGPQPWAKDPIGAISPEKQAIFTNLPGFGPVWHHRC